MKKIALLALSGCALTVNICAQQPFDNRIAISKEITRHTNWDSAFAKQKSFAYFFAITISYNQQGEVDTVYFTEKLDDQLRSILKPGELAVHLMNSKYLPQQYKDKIVMYPVMYKYAPDHIIPFSEETKQSWLNIWPVLREKDKKKQLVLLQPF